MAKLASTTVHGNLNVLETINAVNEILINNGVTLLANEETFKYKNKQVVTVDGAANTTFDINVASANKWKTARTLTFTGDTTGSGSIDGSGNVSIAMTHRDTSTQASITSTIPTMIQNVTLDGMGHVTGLTTYNLDSRYYTESEINTQMGTKIDKGGYTGTALDLKNYADTKVALYSSDPFLGLHRAGDNLHWYLQGSTYKSFWDTGNFNPETKLNKSGDTMSGVVKFVAATSPTDTTTPTQIGCGCLSSYGPLRLLANTDNTSNDEPVIIASAKGLTTSENDGLAVGSNYLRFLGHNIYHAGNKPTKADIGLSNVNNWGASSSISANSTAEYATTNMVAQVRNEKLNNRSRDNWNDGSVLNSVVGQLAWKNYNNGHTIFDASAGTSPTGVAIDKDNPSVSWSSSYPTLMGYDGQSTFGVRVDISRKSEIFAIARSINGTNFDGSANITTANWGTTRNLQIGNTAKSVNGSGNVTWSVAEIGAVNKAGDTMSGNLNFSHSGTTKVGILGSVNTDFWFIGGAAATTSNAAYMEISTGDDGNEPIYVRQYGPGSPISGTLVRTATLLDSSGNTSFPGNLSTGGTITGSKVYNAVLNDYAEFFPKLESTITEEGDIIALSYLDDNEVYELATEEHELIVGVHSGEYAHLIGGDNPPEGEDFVEYNSKRYIPVGLMGRVHVKFIGIAKKGMKVVPSNIPGIGRKFDPTTDSYDNVIGYIVQNNLNENIKKVKIKIGK